MTWATRAVSRLRSQACPRAATASGDKGRAPPEAGSGRTSKASNIAVGWSPRLLSCCTRTATACDSWRSAVSFAIVASAACCVACRFATSRHSSRPSPARPAALPVQARPRSPIAPRRATRGTLGTYVDHAPRRIAGMQRRERERRVGRVEPSRNDYDVLVPSASAPSATAGNRPERRGGSGLLLPRSIKPASY
jgi:hypothetical protein